MAAADPQALVTDPHPLDGAIRAHNALLAEGGVALRLERRGQRLGLRGPLPCRQGGERFRVQRISLGLAADGPGLEEARSRLRRVQQQLQTNSGAISSQSQLAQGIACSCQQIGWRASALWAKLRLACASWC
jgi:hypothetical protein